MEAGNEWNMRVYSLRTINKFCDMSGEKISLHKSKIFFSPNVPRCKANGISRRCQIPLTNNLWKYLGVPLIHGRVTKDTFGYVVDRIQANRLEG